MTQPKADDRYLRFNFANPHRVAGLIREFLPPDLVQILDLTRIKRIHDQHIRASLNELRDDLNLQCPLRDHGRVLIRILAEHKSDHDPDLWLQLMRSICTLWENEHVAPVIPILVHTGPKPFRFENPQNLLKDLPHVLVQGMPKFEIQVIDLSQIALDRIQNSPHMDSNAKFAMSILKLSQQENLQITSIRSLIRDYWPHLSRKSQRRTLEATIIYLRTKSHFVLEDIQTLRSTMPLVHPINPKSSFAKELRDERAQGIAEGISQGITEGLERDKIEVIEGMLAKGCDWSFIQDITHLDQQGFENLKSKYRAL